MMVRKKSGIIFALMACILLFAGSVWAADPGYSKSSMGPKLTNGITEEFVADGTSRENFIPFPPLKQQKGDFGLLFRQGVRVKTKPDLHLRL
jgi:hypothetical protein